MIAFLISAVLSTHIPKFHCYLYTLELQLPYSILYKHDTTLVTFESLNGLMPSSRCSVMFLPCQVHGGGFHFLPFPEVFEVLLVFQRELLQMSVCTVGCACPVRHRLSHSMSNYLLKTLHQSSSQQSETKGERNLYQMFKKRIH